MDVKSVWKDDKGNVSVWQAWKGDLVFVLWWRQIRNSIYQWELMLTIWYQRAGSSDIAVEVLLIVRDLQIVFRVLRLHVFVPRLLTSFNQGNRFTYDAFNLIYYQARCLIEYKPCLPIVASLPEYVSLDNHNAMHSDLLIIKDKFIAYVFLNDGSGGPHPIWHFDRRCRISLLEILLDMLLKATTSTCMLVVAHAHNLQNEELPLNLTYLMERQDVDRLLSQFCRYFRKTTGNKLHHF